jgi:hypothetical protein
MDQRKGAILNAKTIKEDDTSNHTESRVFSEKGPQSTHIDSD